MSSSTKPTKSAWFENLSLQEYLSLAYLFLIVLGIISDVIYYKFLGIDILKYSTLLDILITPISIIAHDLRVLVLFLISVVLCYFIITKLGKTFHMRNRHKKWYQKTHNVEREDRRYAQLQNGKGKIAPIAILILSIFLGFEVGRGSKMKEKMESGEIKTSHQLIFKDRDTLDVKMVGQNSTYVFYVLPGEKVVSISPILQNIKKIKAIVQEEKD